MELKKRGVSSVKGDDATHDVHAVLRHALHAVFVAVFEADGAIAPADVQRRVVLASRRAGTNLDETRMSEEKASGDDDYLGSFFRALLRVAELARDRDAFRATRSLADQRALLLEMVSTESRKLFARSSPCSPKLRRSRSPGGGGGGGLSPLKTPERPALSREASADDGAGTASSPSRMRAVALARSWNTVSPSRDLARA